MAQKRSSSFAEANNEGVSGNSRTRKNDLCKVCGDVAFIINYGVLSCPSCKTFFRRHGFHLKNDLKCNWNRNCEITLESRRACGACRFAKCVAVGMSRDLIRKEDLTGKKTLLINRKQEYVVTSRAVTRLPTPSPLNLLNADQSSLNTSNWRLLSNVIHAFDAFNPIFEVQRILNVLHNTPLGYEYNMEQMKCFLAGVYNSLNSSISSTADFRVMTLAEQRSLILRNMHGVWAFYVIYLGQRSDILDDTIRNNPVIPFYGRDTLRGVKQISLRLDSDSVLVKLMIIILTFSSNCYVIREEQRKTNDSLLLGEYRLYGSQNAYVEVLWKYMIYRYGYYESARRFCQLIKTILDAMKASNDIYEQNKFHQDLKTKVAADTEKSLATADLDKTPLWGRKYPT